uniref:Large subunit of RNA polymerase n=1 Tax=Pithovirus LCPAC001 TaxID=2506585 RepID=A0A481Z2I2_9VIRU|nr:MAG: large subunit of RNA polymerase [Pithovirus LCPAC001]
MNFIKTKIRMVTSDSPEQTKKKDTNNDLFFSFNFNHNDVNLEFGSNSLKKYFKISNGVDFNPKFEEKYALKKEKKREKISYNQKDNSIICFYSEIENIDICRLNEIIINILRDKNKNENILERKMEDIDMFLSKPCSMLQQKYYLKEKCNIENEIAKKNRLYNDYYSKTSLIISNYEETTILDKNDLVQNFLDITSDYVRYDLIKINNRSNVCIGCGINIDKIVVLSGSIFICKLCGCENTSFNKINNNSQNICSDNKKRKNDKNFEDAYLRYIGEQNIKLPANLEEKLDEYFKHIGFHKGSVVKKLNLVDDGTKIIRPGTSIDKMILALKKCDFNGYYKHVRYICRVYWGWTLKNYDDLKEELLFRYQVTSSKYSSIKKGSSNLNMNFHILKLFQNMGCPCKSNDFKKVEVPSTIKEYEVYWNKIIKKIKIDHACSNFEGKKLNWK